MKQILVAALAAGASATPAYPQSVSTKIEAAVLAQAETCAGLHSFLRAYPNGKFLSKAQAQIAAECSSDESPPTPSAADPCHRARLDWEAIKGIPDRQILKVFIDSTPTECRVQRALAEAQLANLAGASEN